MGVVYKAQDLKLNRIVALKFLPAHLVEDAQAKTRFMYEAQAAAALQHPNIALTYDFLESEGETVIVMEYIAGETLAKKIKQQKANLREVLDWATEIASGLAAAHEKGTTHRDIKPENIMITQTGGVKIMDFGVAKLRGMPTLTEPGSRVGTLDYAAPELVMGDKGDHRSDIFSFGVVLYELLAAQRPFLGEHDAAVVYAIVNEMPKTLAYFRKDTPTALERLVMKMLAKKPQHRYDQLGEVLQELETLRKTDAAGKFRPSQPSKRRTRIFIYTTLAMLALIMVFIICRQPWFPMSGSMASPQWEAHPQTVLDFGAPGAWDDGSVLLPYVFADKDTLKMYYSGFDDNYFEGTGQIGYAWSLDGFNWRRYPGNPVLAVGREWDDGRLVEPVVMRDGDSLRMWYGGARAGKSMGPPGKIGYATSSDGINWRRFPQPVLQEGKADDWDSGFCIPSAVIREGDTLKMWFCGGTDFPAGVMQAGLAFSTDFIHWTKFDDPRTVMPPFHHSDPVLKAGLAGEWDQQRAAFGYVRKSATGYEMWYAGQSTAGMLYYPLHSIGFAGSDNGHLWEKHPFNPVFKCTEGKWTNDVFAPSVIHWQGMDFMYFSGSFESNVRARIGLATKRPSSIQDER